MDIFHIGSGPVPHSDYFMRQDESNIIIRKTIGDNLSALRASLKIPQTTFAQMVCIDRSYLNRIEKGTENVSVDILVKIADGLDVPITRLFDGLDVCPPRMLPERYFNYAAQQLPDA